MPSVVRVWDGDAAQAEKRGAGGNHHEITRAGSCSFASHSKELPSSKQAGNLTGGPVRTTLLLEKVQRHFQINLR